MASWKPWEKLHSHPQELKPRPRPRPSADACTGLLGVDENGTHRADPRGKPGKNSTKWAKAKG